MGDLSLPQPRMGVGTVGTTANNGYGVSPGKTVGTTAAKEYAVRGNLQVLPMRQSVCYSQMVQITFRAHLQVRSMHDRRSVPEIQLIT